MKPLWEDFYQAGVDNNVATSVHEEKEPNTHRLLPSKPSGAFRYQ